jgi:hypothetical protein
MLEDIRKLTGVFIAALVLIFIGLIFLESNTSSSGPGSGPVLVKTKYETLSAEDLREDGEGYLRLANRVAQSSAQGGSMQGAFAIRNYLFALGGDAGSEDGLKRFLVNRSNFERARKKYGLHASEDEIALYQREVLFAGNDGIFNQQAYTEFTEDGLKGVGTINDLNDFTADLLTFEKFSEILGSGIVANEEAAQESFMSSAQTMSVTTLSRSLEEFKNEIEPSDEELKAYWEEHRGRYLTEPKRRLTYFIAQPDFDEILSEKKQEEEAGETEKSIAEAAEDAEKTPEELAAESEETILTPEEREKAINELGLMLDEDVWVVLQQQVDSGTETVKLEAQAEKKGYEVKTSELLPISELPAELQKPVRGGRGRTVEQEIIKARTGTGNPMDALSEVLGIDEASWLLFRVDEAVEPTEKTFEEAKEEVTADYKEEKGEEALLAAVKEAREEVTKALEADQTVVEAAEAQGLEASQHLNLTARAQLPNEPNVASIFQLASQTPSGEVSEVQLMQPGADRALFVYVQERQFVENEQNKSGLTRAASQQQRLLQTAIVQHWFTSQYEDAEVEMVVPKA